MTAAVSKHKVESIGTVAGLVWSFLGESGPVTLSKLAREIDAPRDMVMQRRGEYPAGCDERHHGATHKCIGRPVRTANHSR